MNRLVFVFLGFAACAQSHQICMRDGEGFSVGERYVLDGGCGTCVCTADRTFACEREPRTECAVCVDDGGVERASGERWPAGCGDAECECLEGGEVACAPCGGCVDRDGTPRAEGERWPVPGACPSAECWCDDGAIECWDECPPPSCVDAEGRGRWIGETWELGGCPGGSCICLERGEVECVSPDVECPRCMHEGVPRYAGEMWMDGCDRCECHVDGSVECFAEIFCATCVTPGGEELMPGESYEEDGCPWAVCTCQSDGSFHCVADAIECPRCEARDGRSFGVGETCEAPCESCLCGADGFECLEADCGVCFEDDEVFSPGTVRVREGCEVCACTGTEWECRVPAGCVPGCDLPTWWGTGDRIDVGETASRTLSVGGAARQQRCTCMPDGALHCTDDVTSGCVHEGRRLEVGERVDHPGFEWGCTSICECGADGNMRCSVEGTCPPHAPCEVGASFRQCERCDECTCQPDGTWRCRTARCV